MLVFFVGLILLAYDISRKTTFPGSKPKLKEPLNVNPSENKDTTKSTLSPKSSTHQP